MVASVLQNGGWAGGRVLAGGWAGGWVRGRAVGSAVGQSRACRTAMNKGGFASAGEKFSVSQASVVLLGGGFKLNVLGSVQMCLGV